MDEGARANGPAAGVDRLLIASVLLVLAGIGVAGYLTVTHYAGIDPVCAGGDSGCNVVQASEYAELAGVPVALIGLLGYIAIGASLAVRHELAATATLAMTVAGFAFSVYLTYLELFEIDAICQWCIASAIIMTLLMIVSGARAFRPI